MSTAAGYDWLKRHYNLADFTLTHASFIGTSHQIELTSKGNVEETFHPNYAVGQTPLEHVEFGLKYDDLNLEFLKEVFSRIPEEEFVKRINESPSGMYSKKLGYLYEFLTGKALLLIRPVSGNYIDLLDPEYYITGQVEKNNKWKINDNMLGTPAYCPIVRKTKVLKDLLGTNIQEKLKDLKRDYSPEIFQRAISYL